MAGTSGLVTANTGGFAIELHKLSPALPFDPNSSSVEWWQLLPDNYWDIDNLERAKQSNGGAWPVLTVERVVIKPVVDPTEDENNRDYSSKVCLRFVGISTELVMNKSRCQLAEQLTGTPNLHHWAERLGQIELSVGALNKRLQITFRKVGKLVEGNLDELWTT